MSPRNRLSSPALTRRAVLGLGVLGVAGTTAGCRLNNPYVSHPTPAKAAVADLAPDVALAVEAATALHAASRAVSGTGSRFPGLESRLAPLRRLHAAHLAALAEAVPDRVDVTSEQPAYQVPVRRSAALTKLVAAETRLHNTLVGQALRAESGEFARLLGAMAAGLSQHLAVVRG